MRGFKKVKGSLDIDKSKNYYFEIIDEVKITIEKNVNAKLYLISNNLDKDFKIKVKDHANVEIYELSINSNSKKIIKQKGEESTFKYFEGNINNKISNIVYDVFVTGDRSKNELIVHGLNLGKDEFNIEIVNDFNKKEISTTQESIIYDLGDGKNNIKPVLLVGSDNIDAEHSSYIGKFNTEEIFYLMSRGINEEESKRLLIDSFLLSKMNLDDLVNDEFIKIIDKELEKL